MAADVEASPATADTTSRLTWSSLLSLLSLIVIVWTLLFAASYGVQWFFERANGTYEVRGFISGGVALEDQFSCMQRTIDGLTSPGESVRIPEIDGNFGLYDETYALVVPRLVPVASSSAPLIAVTARPAGNGNCGMAQITVSGVG